MWWLIIFDNLTGFRIIMGISPSVCQSRSFQKSLKKEGRNTLHVGSAVPWSGILSGMERRKLLSVRTHLFPCPWVQYVLTPTPTPFIWCWPVASQNVSQNRPIFPKILLPSLNPKWTDVRIWIKRAVKSHLLWKTEVSSVPLGCWWFSFEPQLHLGTDCMYVVMSSNSIF